jgi:NAD(P)-dependent dehydrogenase (short-subunit alcohol dehydrogenase family)
MTIRTILITGATAGIGRHAALHLAARGHRVFATGRNLAALAELQAEAGRLPLETVQLDVTSPASIRAAADEVLHRTAGRGVDVLVNNAGYGLAGPLAEIPLSELRAQLETNVLGLHAVTAAFLPQLRSRAAEPEAPRARILNVSSIGGRVTFPLFGAYHASKYAVEAMSDALRNELAPLGIDVILIEPGPIRSEFSARSRASIERVRTEESVYAPIYARADAIQARSDAQSFGPEIVSRAMERAITTRRPRARYLAPARTLALIALFKLLPTRWIDRLLRAVLGLTPARLALPASQRRPA